MAKRVWITGAAGLIGSHILRSARPYGGGWDAVGLDRSLLDLEDAGAIRAAFSRETPDAVIHCAAMSRSPACQADPVRARSINVGATRVLTELAANAGIPFLFFSTDLIFDGLKGNYVETDAPNPLSVYAETKVEAEAWVRQVPGHCIIRTSLNHGDSRTGDRSFNEDMVRAWREGRTLSLFTDEYRSPVPVEATARVVWELLQRGSTGTFHLGGSERLSRFEIGQLIASQFPGLEARMIASSLKEYRGAPRSPDTSLDSTKLQRELSFKLPGLRSWLQTPASDRLLS